MKNVCISILLTTILFSCQKPSVEETFQTENVPSGTTNRTVAPSILQWQKCLGSSATDMGFSVINAADNSGYILAGNTLGGDGDVSINRGRSDAWIVKLNEARNIVWQQTFGGSLSDNAYDVAATSDGGYIFCGATYSNDGEVAGMNHGDVDAWIVKLSASGTMEWQKVFGGSGTERAMSVIQTSDGSYIVAANTNSNDGDLTGINHGGYDGWLIKLSNNGDLVWHKTYGGSLGEDISSVLPLTDGNFLVCAGTNSSDGDLAGIINRGGTDTWLFKLDANGNVVTGWNKTYGGSNNEGGGTVFPAADGGYVFSTATGSNNGDVSGNHGYVDTWVVKIDANGNKQWQKCYGGFDMDNARIRHIEPSGNLVVVGYTFSRNGDIPGSKGGEDLWVLRLGANGNFLSSNILGGKGGDMANDAIATPDGMFITAGRSNSRGGDVSGNHGGEDMWVVKFKF